MTPTTPATPSSAAAPARGAPVILGPPGPEPADRGRFGDFGGRFVPETLIPALMDLEAAFRRAWSSDDFRGEFAALLTSYAGRHMAEPL